jgi:DNA-binding MarR family transcriptional regulator
MEIARFLVYLLNKLLRKYAKIGTMSRPGRKQLIESLGVGVRRSMAGAILFNQKVADEVGITLRDLQVIHLLQLNGPSQPRDLARWAFVTTGGMTVVLDRLEKARYVRREPNPADRRSCIVHLIPESLRKFLGIYQSKGDHLAKVLAQYSDRDLRVLAAFYEKLNKME